jgi:hypothetical protein
MLPCCAGRPLSRLLRRHNVGANHPAPRPRATSLLPPPLLAPRAAPSSLQVPSPTPRRHRALARPCTPRGHNQPLPVQLTTPMPAYGQNSHPSCALHGARCHCASASPERTPTLPLCRRVELSHYPHTHAATHAAPSVLRLRGYIRPIPLAYCPPSVIRWSSGEPPSPPCSASAVAAAEIPSHRLSFLFHRPRSSAGPQSCSQTSSSHFFFADEPSVGAAPVSFRFLVARPPSYELLLLSMLGRSVVRLGCSRKDLAMIGVIAARHRLRHGGRSVCMLRCRCVLCAHPARVWAATCGPAPHVLGHARPSHPVLWLDLTGRAHAVRVGRARFRL